jgi:hypothetical protein
MEYRIALLTRAIQNKLVINLDYEPGWRVIEPHALGYSSDRKILLRAYQLAGTSASNEPTGWKLLRVDRIKEIGPEGSSFSELREGYTRGDPAMKGGIIAQL